MVVGMHHRIISLRTAQQLDGAVGNHLIGGLICGVLHTSHKVVERLVDIGKVFGNACAERCVGIFHILDKHLEIDVVVGKEPGNVVLHHIVGSFFEETLGKEVFLKWKLGNVGS